MKRIIALLLALVTTQAFGVDLKKPRNRSSNGKLSLSVNDGGTMTDYVTLNPTTHGVDIHGRTDGGAACTGCVGEKLETLVTTNQSFTTGYTNVATLNLTAGTWLVTGEIVVSPNGTSNAVAYAGYLSLTSASPDANYEAYIPTTSFGVALTLPPRVVTTTGSDSNKTVYAVITCSSIGGGPPLANPSRVTATRLN